jgi:hypothetical protein
MLLLLERIRKDYKMKPKDMHYLLSLRLEDKLRQESEVLRLIRKRLLQKLKVKLRDLINSSRNMQKHLRLQEIDCI